MADGKIIIEVDVDGKGVAILNDQLGDLEKGSGKATVGIKDLTASILLVKVASAAFDVLKNSLDEAIQRFDTMERYPKVMTALGFSTDESSESVNRLSDGIDGLPTKLNDVVSTTQRMTSITGNIDKSTDATLALNNAMLASGSSADDAARGTEQYIKMLSTGKVDLQSWKTLQETMPIGLQKTAEAMGFVGVSAQQDLYKALQEGEVTFDQFQNQLIALGTGTGELAELAKINSEGIATSFSNLQNAAVKGIEHIIRALDDLAKAVTGKTIAQNLDSLKVLVNATFDAITDAIRGVTPFIEFLGSVLGTLLRVFEPLIPTMLQFVEALIAMKVIQEVGSMISNTEMFIKAYCIATDLAALATSSFAREQLLESIITAKNNAIIAIKTALLTAHNIMLGSTNLLTGLLTVATTALGAAMKLLLGPIGWATAAFGALVTITVSLVKWFNREREEVVALREEQEELLSTTSEMVQKNEDAAKSRKNEIEALASAKDGYTQLVQEMDMLSQKEQLSTAEKKRMAEITEELNGKMDGLNIAYDEQNNKLSEQPEKIQKQIDAFHALDEASSAQERINDMLQQRNDNEAKLMEINIARDRWNETLEQAGGNTKEARKNLEELNAEEQTLLEAQDGLRVEILSTADTIDASAQSASDAVANGTFDQGVSYELLQGKTKETMDNLRAEYTSLEDKVGNAFDAIEQKQAISAEQMTENLLKNQEATAQWSENVGILAERGVEQGLLDQLRKMGPEGAAQAAELVNSSDEQLQRLNEVYRNTGESSMGAMREGYQFGKYGVDEEIANMIPTQKDTLANQVINNNFADIGKNLADDVASGVENARTKVAESTKGLVTGSEKAMNDAVGKADFVKVGLAIPEGLEKGVEQGKGKPIDAVKGTSTDLINSAKDELRVNSPSKEFISIGESVTEGLTKGIEKDDSAPKQALVTLVQGMLNEMKSFPNSMNSVGQDAMAGLANGIYAGSSTAMAAARSVANDITKTMQSALDIHSPSRVMRDLVGRFIPQGVAEGIEKDSSVALNAVDHLSSLLSKRFVPEAGLDINSFGAAGNVNMLQAKESKNKEQGFDVVINIEHADMSSDESIEEMSRKLGVLARRELKGSLV